MTEFYKLPQDIAARRDLLPSDKLVYAVVLNCLNGRGVCWPGKRFLAERTGLSGQAVLDAISRLEQAGLLVVERQGNGRSNRYKSGQEIRPVKGLDRSNPDTTGGQEIRPEAVKRLDHKRKNNLKEESADKAVAVGERSQRRFTPPTLADIKTYVDAKGLSVDPKFFLDYFTESRWIDSRGNPVKNWKQKLLTWDSHGQKRQSQKTPTAKETEDHEARYITDPETVERIHREVGLC